MSKYKYEDDNLPTFEIVLNEDDPSQGIRFISLVKNPAIDIQGMAFNKEGVFNQQFKTIPDQQMIVGPTMIPYKKIKRQDPETKLMYNVIFTPDTIKKLVDRFNSGSNNRAINIDHTNQTVNGYIQQNWIVADPVYDKSRYYGYNLQVGSHFAEIKCEDKTFWEQEVREAGRFSFSIEGMLGQRPYQFDKIKNIELNAIIDQLTQEEIEELLVNWYRDN